MLGHLLTPASLAVALVVALGCGEASAPPRPVVRLWHTFDREETEALNRALVGHEPAVETTVIPFARGMTVVGDVLAAGDDCPDLVRVDATWVPGLARRHLLAPVPELIWQARAYLAAAERLVSDRGVRYGLPQALEGLALVYRPATLAEVGLAAPPTTVGELVALAHRLTLGRRWGLGLRSDGYWFLAFLRARGGRALDPDRGEIGIDQPEAIAALREFAGLFGDGGVAPPPPPMGDEEPSEVRRFRAGELALVLDGPWALWQLAGGHVADVAIAPFARDPSGHLATPAGGQVYVVPSCAAQAAAAWQLALELTRPELAAAWGRELGVVPTTAEGLAAAGPTAQAFARAIADAEPLARHPLSAEMFDDLTPAIAATVAGDATAEEALGGVARAWRRLIAREAPR